MKTQKQVEKFIVEIGGQSYGLNEALDKYISGRLACEEPDFQTGQYSIDIFQWVRDNGEEMNVVVQMVSVITQNSEDEDDISAQQFFMVW